MQRQLEERVARHCENREGVNGIADDISPIDFEGMCAAALRRAGWNASTTMGPGDQGKLKWPVPHSGPIKRQTGCKQLAEVSRVSPFSAALACTIRDSRKLRRLMKSRRRVGYSSVTAVFTDSRRPNSRR